MARFPTSPDDSAVKFQDRLNAIKSKALSADISQPTSSNSTLNALSKFLSSFGPKVDKLSKTSRNALMQHNSVQDQNMREQAIDELAAHSKKQIKDAFEKYEQKKIDITALRATMHDVIKKQGLASAIIGVKGVGNLTDNVLTAVKRQLSVQLAQVDEFLSELDSRKSNKKDRTQILKFANNGWQISYTAARQLYLDQSASDVQLEERRRLGGSEHCEDCIELADDWQPIGTLPVPGQGTECGLNCRCTMEVRPIQEETKQTTLNGAKDPIKQV